MTLKLNSELQKYQVYWLETDSYDDVYLHIESIKPVKIVKGEELAVDTSEKKYSQNIMVSKSESRNWIEQHMANTTYLFTLYSKQKDVGILCEKTAYWGIKEKIFLDSRSCGERMKEIIVKCPFRVSEEWFWLELSNFHNIMQFRLPPMEKENDMFQTSCLVREEVCDQLTIGFDERIVDYFEVKK